MLHFPLTTSITRLGKTPVRRQYPASHCFQTSLQSSAKHSCTYRVVVQLLQTMFFELLDSEMLSGLHDFLNIYQQDYLRAF